MVESFQYLSGLPMETKEPSFKKDQKWFEETARKQDIKLKFTVARQYQQIAEEAVKVLKRDRLDFIVSASHSGPISSAILGSTAKKILRFSHRPMLVIK